ncbi:hypothetical protein VIGAN_05183200 [Vigna angularis var. angularis]|uniref:Knottin scorpion toxin-like domain-containing protein n=1 Tax=Vigna angularis var. angularis TaxID=157739 RepID=A0A0S3S6A8_PHAAN|nr:hypothetical protein VIGAN_05183200 [Vigna angularis var. angularis]
MAKTSLFPSMMILFLIISATGFVDACDYPCHGRFDCHNLHCNNRCLKRCINFCCLCECSGNEKPEIKM